jgi:hypothetical protein
MASRADYTLRFKFDLDSARATGLSLCVNIFYGDSLPSLKIPDRYKPGIVVLSALSDEVFESLDIALQKAPIPGIGQKELAAWVSSEIVGPSKQEIRRLIETLASLYRLRKRSAVQLETLVADVTEAASKDGLNISADRLSVRLAKLLVLDSLNLIDTKAKELQLEAEHTLCDARIITDLRPVFGGNVSDSPDAMIIVHTLKLGYHNSKNQQHVEMYIALDADDIGKMIEVLKRAQEKSRTLKQKLEASGIRIMDV